jgi:hypothetical protein
MSKIIQIKRGRKAGIPTLAQGELGYTTDTKELYIGTDTGNQSLGANYFTTTIATAD